jgi:hypothetical protein
VDVHVDAAGKDVLARRVDDLGALETRPHRRDLLPLDPHVRLEGRAAVVDLPAPNDFFVFHGSSPKKARTGFLTTLGSYRI